MTTTQMVPVDTLTFDNSHLQSSLKYIDPQGYPELYSNLYGGLKFKGRKLMNMGDFQIDLPTLGNAKTKAAGSMQTARILGEGINKDEVHASLDKGYLLSKVPPSIVWINGIPYLCNGRTRYGKLKKQNKTNMIVDCYEADNWDAFHFFAIMSNRASEPESPHTLMDVKHYCDVAIKNNHLERTWDTITERVEAIVNGTFSKEKKKRIVTDIFHGDNLSTSFVAYDEKTSQEFLTKGGYIDNVHNNGIYYFVVSSAFHSKALTNVAKYYDKLLTKGKLVKELRIIIHTSVLEGEDPIECWKKRIDKFRRNWSIQKNQMRQAWYTTSAKEKNIISLYGATPACEELPFPMDKAVLFDKGVIANHFFDELDEQFNPKQD